MPIISDSEYAQMALLVMYAWDMCDKQFNDPSFATLDPRILKDGWNVVGLITGADDIAISGPSIRQQVIAAGKNIRRYGYLAVNVTDPTKYIAVIRGTDGAEEWMDDFDFVSTVRAPFPGRVESGFVDIYQSMQYFPLADPTKLQNLADGIAATVPKGALVTVLGHSLGSSLATFLTYDLCDPARLGNARVSAILFASPKTGDQGFVTGFASRVTDFIVINYQNDIVPTVPPFDISHFDLYRTLPICRILTDNSSAVTINTANKACCHHLISYAALLSTDVFTKAESATGWTTDDTNCAKCVTLPLDSN